MTSPQATSDRQRLARQAIRSQSTAREYAERHLVRAEQTIQDLQAKLHAARREKDVATKALRTAHAAQGEAKRGRRAAETALINERSARDGAQQDAREARAIIQDLRTKLASARDSTEALQAQLAQAGRVVIAAEPPTVAPADTAPEDQPVKRKRGRPPGKRNSLPRQTARKTCAANQEPVQWWTEGWVPGA